MASTGRSATRTAGIYALALLLTLATFYARHLLPVGFGERPLLILFMFPILVGALAGGPGPGLSATAVAALLTAYFLVPPVGSLHMASRADQLQWAMLVGCGVLASGLSGLLRHSRRAEALRALQLDAAQDALQRAERRFGATFEQAAVGMAMISRQGHWLQVNPALCQIVGYSREELQSLTFGAITHPQDRETDEANMRKVASGEALSYRRQKRYIRKGGSTVWVNVSAAAVRKADGSADYFVSVIEDIHARRVAELRIERLASLNRALSLTNEAIARERDWHTLCAAVCRIAVEQGGLTYARIRMHDAAAGTLPLFASYGVLAGPQGLDVVPVDSQAPTAVAFRQRRPLILDDATAPDVEVRARTDALTNGIASAAHFPMHRGGASSDGTLIGTLAVFAALPGYFDAELTAVLDDMAANLAFAHAKIAAERALTESERRYRSLVHDSLSGIMLLAGTTIEYGNAGLARMLGCADAGQVDADAGGGGGLAGRDLLEFVEPAMHGMVARKLRALARRPGRVLPPVALRLRRLGSEADGNAVETMVAAASIELDGRLLVQAEVRDITREVRALAEVQDLNRNLEKRITERTAELTRANRDLEAFASSVAHDLRAPLRSMSGFARLMQGDVEAGRYAELPHYVGRVTANADRMGALIDGLLQVAHASHAALESRPVDMNVLVRETLSELRPVASVRLAVGPLPAVSGDAAMLRQVWANLLSNALKYSGRRLHPEIAVEGAVRGGEAVFQVRDNGAGFDAAYAGKLFGMFQRLHSTSDFEGTGVGLAITRAVVERHGGRIWADSRLGEGAAFYFALPAQAASGRHHGK